MEFRKHTVILSVIERLRSRRSRTGKTHVQKALALLAVASEIDIPFEFVLYKHGPYSFDVERELEQMLSYAAVDVQPNVDGYGVTIRPGSMGPFVKQQASLSPEEEAAIDRVCDLVGSKTVTQLERVATAAWIHRCERITAPQKVAERLHKLKPHVSIAEAKAADREFRRFQEARQ